jgi:hypothetical protein
MLSAQGYGFTSHFFSELDYLEKSQEVFNTILFFGVANTDKDFDPTEA